MNGISSQNLSCFLTTFITSHAILKSRIKKEKNKYFQN